MERSKQTIILLTRSPILSVKLENQIEQIIK